MTSNLPRWMWWIAGLFLLCWFIFAVRGILLPFVVGLAIAYLLDPVADYLERWRVPRWLATTLVLVLFFGLAAALLFAMTPILRDQINGFARALPGYVDQLRPFVMQLIDQAGGQARAQELVERSGSQIAQWGAQQVGVLLASGLALFNLLTLVLISPVVAFYLLRDWDKLIARVDSWLPRHYEPTIRMLLGQADGALSGFVRGQFLVCLCLAALYAIGWSLLGLNYSLILGLIAGMLAFVPFAGPFFGAGLAVLVAIGQFGGDYMQIGLVYGVFIVVQVIEGSVLTPNLIGERVGLHPAWVLFAVFAGGEMMGVVGIFLAVPVAAVVAVVARWAVDRYLDSPLYGTSVPPPEPPLSPPSSPSQPPVDTP